MFGILPWVVPEARLEPTEHGLVPRGEGWFVLNALDARWLHAEGRPAVCEFEGESTFAQVGVNLCVLHTGEPMAMYHWEDDQEDFLVLAGEALLIVEGQERWLRRWDLVHCPPRTDHVIVGVGDGPCLVLALGAREHPRSGGFRVEPVALRHGACVAQETSDPQQAYASVQHRRPTQYREGWLRD